MKFTFSLILLIAVSGTAICQNNEAPKAPAAKPPAGPKIITDGNDPLGRPYHPTIGILPAVASTPDIDPSITNYMGIAYANGFKGNAYTPYGAVSKDKFDELRLILRGVDKADMKKYYYAEAVGVEYLVRLDVNKLRIIVTPDTIRKTPADPKSPVVKVNKTYHCFAGLTAAIIDVSTTNLVRLHNFNVYSNSSGAQPVNNQTDSTVALVRLYEKIGQAAGGFHQLLSGVGVIDSVLEEKKDKVKMVRVNYNKIMNLKPKGSVFEVYLPGETFETGGVVYQQSEKVGRLLKPESYNYLVRNFQPYESGSELNDAIKSGKTLVASHGALPLSAHPVSSAIPSILIDTFQVKVKGSPGLARMFQEEMTDQLSRRSQLFKVVNRTSFKDVETERAIQSKTKSDATQAGITIGAEYLITGEIIDYQFGHKPLTKTEQVPDPNAKEEPAKTQPQAQKPAAPVSSSPAPKRQESDQSAPGKRGGSERTAAQPGSSQGTTTTQAAATPAKPPAPPKPKTISKTVVTGMEASASVTIETRMISVKTGEILWSKMLGAKAVQQFGPKKSKEDVLVAQEMVNNLLVDNFASFNINEMVRSITRPLPILKVLETDKKGIDKVLVGGGEHAGINANMKLIVVEETVEMVDNQPLKRETEVAELRLKDVFPETSAWKVKDGGELLQARMAAQAKLYCKIRLD